MAEQENVQEEQQEPAQEQAEQEAEQPEEAVEQPDDEQVEEEEPYVFEEEAQQGVLVQPVSTLTQLVDAVMDMAEAAGWQAHVVENDQGFPPYVFTKITDSFTGVIYAFLLDDGEAMDQDQIRTQKILTGVGTTCHQWYPNDHAKAAEVFA